MTNDIKPENLPPVMNRISAIWLIPLVAWGFGQLYPIFVTFVSGLKTRSEVYTKPLGFPESPVWSNYATAWDVGASEYTMATFMANGLFVTIIALVVVLGAGSIGAWYLARGRLASKLWVDATLIMLIAMPSQVVLIPTWEIASALGLRDSLFVLAIVTGVETLPFAIVLFKATYMSFPKEILDAAVLDGANNLRVFRRIVMPLTKGTYVAIAVVTGIGFWNEFQWTLVLISEPAKWTVPFAVASFSGQFASQQEILWAAVGLSIIPSILFFLALNRQISGGVRMGGVKG